VKTEDPQQLKLVLSKSLGVKAVVEKIREIFYIQNVKFHIDNVKGLGSFVEIEAGNIRKSLSEPELRRQCEFYLDAFRVNASDLLTNSYSDMILDSGSIL
jgi:adenylate cyclase, class 2